MPKEAVAAVVEEALREVQELGGYEWVEIPPSAPIVGALPGFDSLIGIEATVIVEQKLGTKLGQTAPVSLGPDSIFVSKDGTRALRFDEVVASVCSILEAA